MAKFQAVIYNQRGKRAGIVETLEGDNLQFLVEDTVQLVKSFPRGRPFPIEFFNIEGEEPVLVDKARIQGDRFIVPQTESENDIERIRAAITPVRSTTLRRMGRQVVFTADDVLEEPLTRSDFDRARRFRREEFKDTPDRPVQRRRREEFRELIDTEDFEPGRPDQ